MALALALVAPLFTASAQEEGPGAQAEDPVAVQEAAEPEASPPAATAIPEPAPAVRVLPTGGLRMETAALLLSGQQGGPLPLFAYAAPQATAGERIPVNVVIEADGSDLLTEQAASPLYLEVCVYALGPANEVHAAVLQTVALDLEQVVDALAAGGVKLSVQLALPPGEHSLRILVRNVTTDNLGLLVLPLAVGASDRRPSPALLATLFADEPETWLAVEVGELATGGSRDPGVLPAARPVLDVDRPATFQLVAANLPPEPELRVELRRARGELAHELPVRVTERAAAVGEGLELVTAAFDVAGVDPGELELRVVTADGRARSPALQVVFASGLAGRSWAAVTGDPPPAATAAAAEVERTARRRGEREPDRGPILAGYREALALLAAGDVGAARGAVAALERRLLSEERTVTVEQLGGIVAGLAGTLAAADSEAVVPLLALYQELYRLHSQGRDTLLATHSRELVFQLAQIYAGDRAAPPEARQLAATALVAFTGELPPTAGRLIVSRILRQALTYAPGHPGALLALAIDAERSAEPETAVQRLQELLRIEPAHAEARLRLGINRGRLGARKAAVDILAGLLADPVAASEPPPWWLPIAYQELARLHLAGGDGAAAEALVRRGLERLPGEEKLSLLLARALAERGQLPQARATLAGYAPVGGDRGFDGARHRYPQLPPDVLRQAQVELRQSAGDRRERLSGALAAVGGRR